jgi:CheY-like chemotaxis protein
MPALANTADAAQIMPVSCKRGDEVKNGANKISMAVNMAIQSLILLVEDSADDALLFKRAAQKVYPEAAVHVVEGVEEAIAFLEEATAEGNPGKFPPPFCVFVDLALPKAPGKDLIKWIRGRPQFKKLLIVVLTGTGQMRDMRELYRMGANSFLLKTPDAEDLAKALQEMNSYWIQQGAVSSSGGHDTDFFKTAPRNATQLYRRRAGKRQGAPDKL